MARDYAARSAMGTGLVFGVARRLQLKGRVFDVEVIGETVLEVVEDASDPATVQAVVGDHDVGARARAARR